MATPRKKKRTWVALFAGTSFEKLEDSCNNVLGKPGAEYVDCKYQDAAPDGCLSVILVYNSFDKLH